MHPPLSVWVPASQPPNADTDACVVPLLGPPKLLRRERGSEPL
jgi:hypothetical protein